MSRVLQPVQRSDGGLHGYRHWCPGCEEQHVIPTQPTPGYPHPVWAFDGDLTTPTFSPSVRRHGPRRAGEAAACCHYNVTGGRLVFHGDCTHALAGHAVPMVALPDER